MKIKKNILIGEFLGSCFLVMIIVGSGIMAENLTNDDGIKLLANTIATGAPVAIVLAKSLIPSSFVRFSAIIPEPTMIITRKQLPKNSPISMFFLIFIF